MDLSGNVVAFYKCNDDAANTTVTNEVGTDAMMVDANTEDQSIAGKIDKAFNFEDSSDYVNLNQTFQATLRGSFSVSLWAKPADGVPSDHRIFVGSQDTTGADSLFNVSQYKNTGQLRVDYMSEGNRGNIAQTNSAVWGNGAVADWHHIVAVLDSTVGGVGGKKIYFDGEEVALDGTYDGSTSGVTFGDFTTAKELYVARYNGSSNYDYYGGIDALVIFNKALTASEVSWLYNYGDGTERVSYPNPPFICSKAKVPA